MLEWRIGKAIELPGPERPRGSEWRRRFLGVVLALLLVALILAGYSLRKAHLARQRLQTDLQAVADMESWARRQGNRRLFDSLLDPEAALAWQVRQGANLAPATLRVMEAHLLDPSHALATVEVQAEGTRQHVSRLYRLTPAGWRLTAPRADLWGPQRQADVPCGQITYRQADGPAVRELVRRGQALCAGRAPWDRLLVTLDPAVDAARYRRVEASGALEAELLLPSPSFIPRSPDQTPAEALSHLVAEALTAVRQIEAVLAREAAVLQAGDEEGFQALFDPETSERWRLKRMGLMLDWAGQADQPAVVMKMELNPPYAVARVQGASVETRAYRRTAQGWRWTTPEDAWGPWLVADGTCLRVEYRLWDREDVLAALPRADRFCQAARRTLGLDQDDQLLVVRVDPLFGDGTLYTLADGQVRLASSQALPHASKTDTGDRLFEWMRHGLALKLAWGVAKDNTGLRPLIWGLLLWVGPEEGPLPNPIYIRGQVDKGRLLPLWRMVTGLPPSALPYSQLSFQVPTLGEYVARAYGQEKLVALIRTLYALGDLDLALNQTLGMGTSRFEYEWRVWLEETYAGGRRDVGLYALILKDLATQWLLQATLLALSPRLEHPGAPEPGPATPEVLFDALASLPVPVVPFTRDEDFSEHRGTGYQVALQPIQYLEEGQAFVLIFLRRLGTRRYSTASYNLRNEEGAWRITLAQVRLAEARGQVASICGPEAALCLAQADGTGTRRLTNDGGYGPPGWSPDGQVLAATQHLPRARTRLTFLSAEGILIAVWAPEPPLVLFSPHRRHWLRRQQR